MDAVIVAAASAEAPEAFPPGEFGERRDPHVLLEARTSETEDPPSLRPASAVSIIQKARPSSDDFETQGKMFLAYS